MGRVRLQLNIARAPVTNDAQSKSNLEFRPFLESLGYRRIFVYEDRAFLPLPVVLDEILTDSEIQKLKHLQAAVRLADPTKKDVIIEKYERDNNVIPQGKK